MIFVFVLGALAFGIAGWEILTGNYIRAIAGCVAAILSASGYLYLRAVRFGMLERDARQYLSSLEKLPFESACSAAEKACVMLPHELAEIRGFSPPAGNRRVRYFERHEIVFRIEEDDKGAARCIFKNA
jgi:hypothetical protein